MTTRILREGLRPNDLEDMVHNIFEIDAFQSKMGEDKDVCVLSFRLDDRNAAKDLMEFIEKGYSFVLDSDVSSGEDNNGRYHVFVELPRDRQLPENVKEIADGLKRLTKVDEWKFRFYKSNKSYELSEHNLTSVIPSSAEAYVSMLENIRVESIGKFFSKTFKEELIVEGNKITIKKPFGVSLSFNMLDFGSITEIQKNISETIKIDTKSMAETMWLTKILGDFNITKYGDTFALEDGKKTMMIKMEI